MLLCLYPVLFLYSQNIHEVELSQIYLPSAVVLGFTAVFLLTLGRILKNGKKASLIVTIFLVLFFSYGHVLTYMEDLQIKFLKDQNWLLFLWFIILVVGIWIVLRIRGDLSFIMRILWVSTFSLLVISTFNIVSFQIKESGKSRASTAAEVEEKFSPIRMEQPRDIYYIILDAYASSETLNNVYHFNNHEFIDYLVGKGFYVASQSRSNYGVTFLSLASSLNMEYLDSSLSNIDINNSKDRTIPYRLISENKVATYLKQHGYSFINFGSGWAGTETITSADMNVKIGGYNEFMMVLINSTALTYFNNCILKRQARLRIQNIFSGLSGSQEMKGPKFIFAHITCPHPPYLFTKNGDTPKETKLQMEGHREWAKRKLYLGQLQYINKQVKVMLEKILAQSGVQPIIILQADHGSASIGRPHPPLDLTDKKIVDSINERMGILNAYYLPGVGTTSLYPSITPVNTFRMIFNLYFHNDLLLLEDRNYYGDYDTPYILTDVTEAVVKN